MGRIVLLFGAFWLGFLLLRENGALLGMEEQIMWALLLPGVYLVGLLMWTGD